MGSGHQYDGIRDAVDSVHAKDGYSGPDELLSRVPSREDVLQFTDALTGFEADATVSATDDRQLETVSELYETSETALQEHAAELGVRSLNEFDPVEVLFMVCIRDLQHEYVGKANLNPHKFSVLNGGRYSVN